MRFSPKVLLLSLPLALSLTTARAHDLDGAFVPSPRVKEFDWMSIADWYRAHADDVEVARKGTAELLFLGDSITQGWQWSPSYQESFEPYASANFGIGGDTTENLLWRLQHGSTGRLSPKAIVLLIGVNDFGHDQDTPEQVFQGIQANLDYLKTAFPDSKILALGIFPWGQHPDDPNRAKAKEVNAMLPALADEQVKTLDIGQVFLADDGSISKDVMGDYLHPTEEGYHRMTKAVLPIIQDWVD